MEFAKSKNAMAPAPPQRVKPFGETAKAWANAALAPERAAAAKQANIDKMNALPQLENRLGSASLGELGQFKASTIAQSPWASMAMQKQGIDQSMAGDALAKTNAMQAAQGRAALGRIGGGGAERAGLSSMLSSAQGRETLAAQGGQQRQAIAQQGAERGLDISQFNAAQQQQANKANVGQSIRDLGQQNAFNQLKFGEQMKYKAGQETGAAMDRANGGKK
jgi:hypothetical protein